MPLLTARVIYEQQGFIDPYNVERQWREQFEWCYREYDTFIFPMSIHPQVSGRPHILLMHERYVETSTPCLC